ncbi:hypothetical protein NHX12_001968 [Muraenolepis orangiensis]|uniref:Uncharacterized protein n=1 Tax=Muraenolepis orangiensis TaxID=630683 RepID=A0A9Q0E3J4_9TELE|nr:hypothetical protein NHX12_001968 [Muraenolepis orangiensis]
MEFVWSTRRSAESEEVSVCQEMLTEFRNAVSCKKNSHSRRRRPATNSAALRGPGRGVPGAPRALRPLREMRLSNGKLYSGTGPLTGGAGPSGGGAGPSGGGAGEGSGREGAEGPAAPELPPGAGSAPPPPGPAPPPPGPAPAMLPARGCSHVRICQECRRIRSQGSVSSARGPPSSAPLPRLAPPPPPSSSNTDSEGGGGEGLRRPHALGPVAAPQSGNTTDSLVERD